MLVTGRPMSYIFLYVSFYVEFCENEKYIYNYAKCSRVIAQSGTNFSVRTTKIVKLLIFGSKGVKGCRYDGKSWSCILATVSNSTRAGTLVPCHHQVQNNKIYITEWSEMMVVTTMNVSTHMWGNSRLTNRDFPSFLVWDIT